jgi:hypothetical protein
VRISVGARVVRGQRRSSPEIAAQLDNVLGVEGRLAALARRDMLKIGTDPVGPVSGSDRGAENGARHRLLAETASTPLLGDVLGPVPDMRLLDAGSFVPVLTGHSVGSGPDGPLPGLSALSAAAADARRKYQACRYSELIGQLPGLLARLQATRQALDGDARSRVLVLAADAYHVAAGVLLKLDDQGLGRRELRHRDRGRR